MKIGELADRTGVSVRALRYYEEKGVLKPDRTPSGYRLFVEEDVQTVAHVQTLLTAGLGMELVGEILSCMSGESLLLDDCRERLRHERQRMSDRIDRLAHARSMLDDLLATTSASAERTAPASSMSSSPPSGHDRRSPASAAEVSGHQAVAEGVDHALFHGLLFDG